MRVWLHLTWAIPGLACLYEGTPTPPEVEDTQSFSERADAWLASIDDRIRALNARCGHEPQPTERKP
jgi:nitrite reductase/ring-hydroxylating ferredoxin subunit